MESLLLAPRGRSGDQIGVVVGASSRLFLRPRRDERRVIHCYVLIRYIDITLKVYFVLHLLQSSLSLINNLMYYTPFQILIFVTMEFLIKNFQNTIIFASL